LSVLPVERGMGWSREDGKRLGFRNIALCSDNKRHSPESQLKYLNTTV
jgi:hypothetical protein